MIVAIIFIAILFLALVACMMFCVSALEEIEELRISNKELLKANYKLTKKKNGK